jgi:hypothetical protein
MKVGDLIVDKKYPKDAGMILKIKNKGLEPYLILCTDGVSRWFSRIAIEDGCEVASESR